MRTSHAVSAQEEQAGNRQREDDDGRCRDRREVPPAERRDRGKGGAEPEGGYGDQQGHARTRKSRDFELRVARSDRRQQRREAVDESEHDEDKRKNRERDFLGA